MTALILQGTPPIESNRSSSGLITYPECRHVVFRPNENVHVDRFS
jgi:hypothetical protein